jgi:hypothetical protein
MCFTASEVDDTTTGAQISPAVTTSMFSGANNQGRFLPPAPTGFSDWVYKNDAFGVYLQTTAPADSAALNALDRLLTKFATCQADYPNYNGCGARCFTAWIQRNACP